MAAMKPEIANGQMRHLHLQLGNTLAQQFLVRHGRLANLWRVIVQEGAPALAWWPAPLVHVFGHARLRDFKAELEQLAVNARRSP